MGVISSCYSNSPGDYKGTPYSDVKYLVELKPFQVNFNVNIMILVVKASPITIPIQSTQAAAD